MNTHYDIQFNKLFLPFLPKSETYLSLQVAHTEEPSYFRILAPEIVCPKDENSVIDKPDNTVVT